MLLVLLLALFPYLLTCFYALPFADDFCYGWTGLENISFLQKFLKQYLYWSGRYTAIVLGNCNPVSTGSLFKYQFALFSFLVLMLFGLFAFIQQILKDWLGSLIVSLGIMLFYLCYQPNVTEGVYWYTGAITYHWCNAFILFHLAFALSAINTGNRLYAFISTLLLIAATGFNEVAAALLPGFYLLAVIVTAIGEEHYRKHFKLTCLFFVVALFSSALVVLSPGSYERSMHFNEHGHLLHSLWRSALQTGRFIVQWVFAPPFLLLSLLVAAYAHKIENTFVRTFSPKVVTVLLFFSVFMGAFIPYMAMGILGQHRTINFVMPWFIFLWLWLVVILANRFALSQWLNVYVNRKVSALVVVLCAAVMLVTGNGRHMLNDYAHGNFKAYKAAFITRQQQVLLNPQLPMLPITSVPETFTIVDAKADSTWWVDKCMRHFYTETGVELR